jgi:hypothetical protein
MGDDSDSDSFTAGWIRDEECEFGDLKGKKAEVEFEGETSRSSRLFLPCRMIDPSDNPTASRP